MRILLYTLSSLLISAYSLYYDWGGELYTWFQRSGALVLLAGLILGYKGMIKHGVRGVGVLQLPIVTGTVKGVNDKTPTQKVKIEYSEQTKNAIYAQAIEKICNYFGAILTIVGTIICGYGDLLAKIF